MSNFAWVTLTTNDTYSLGALVLAHSLRRVGTAHQLAVLVTPSVSASVRDRLRDVFNVVQEVDVLDSHDAANLALLARPELGVTFTKLHCWRLVQFEKCVFLDADTLVLQNCDELFEREELSAAPDVSWPDCFNSGVFVYKPNVETFNSITQFAVKQGSFDGGDQGLLNSFFSDWAHKDISKHLPFIYNVAAYASYCYLPAFKQFRDKIKILHFAGKLKPWLIHFNSESRTASTPSDYGHAADFVQLWWNIFCDNVHKTLNDTMHSNESCQQNYENVYNYNRNINNDSYNNKHFQWQFAEGEVQEYTDPWADFYVKEVERESMERNISDNESQHQCPEQHRENEHYTTEAYHRQEEFSHSEQKIVPPESSYIEMFEPVVVVLHSEDEHRSDERYHQLEHNENVYPETTSTITANDIINDIPYVQEESSYNDNTNNNNNNNNITESYHCQSEENESNIGTDVEIEAGLAGALSQLRLGVQRTPEQEAYEALMRRQCWESGQIDYSGRDSFENIWAKISHTLDQKPSGSPSRDQSEHLTSADIEDGKIEYDRDTGASTKYHVIEGGYEMITTTPQPNGTVKTSTRTFWDPKPVSAEDMVKQAENKKSLKQRLGKEVRIDKNTTMLTREIEGGYEEVYTTIQEDGTRATRTKTFWDAVAVTDNDDGSKKKTSTTATDKKTKTTNALVKRSSIDSQDSTTGTRTVVQKAHQETNVVQKQQQGYNEESTYQETRRFSQSVEVTENNRTVRKKSIQQEQNSSIVQSQTTSGQEQQNKKIQKKKTKSAIPPPPPDFIENETTTVISNRVPGGIEYTYSTKLESGKTITTTKTIYEEQESELTEEEIKEYKKTLKDAEKHKNVTATKKLKSESGTKKIVPSENPGDVTTVETIKIEGGTEHHYTTVTAEGIVKKSVKTIYDPVSSKRNDDDTDEEEIVEEYEEEIIEPGEKNIRTIETIKTLPSRIQEEVTITHEKKEKKVKKSMVISQ